MALDHMNVEIWLKYRCTENPNYFFIKFYNRHREGVLTPAYPSVKNF